MGTEKITLDNYVRTAKRSAPQGEPFMDQPRSGTLQRASDDVKAKLDMQSEGGSQDASARPQKSPAR